MLVLYIDYLFYNLFSVNLLLKFCISVEYIFSLGRRVGTLEFEIPKHVLDIVYGQTLCWLGMFYAPLLPAITCVKLGEHMHPVASGIVFGENVNLTFFALS